jgi:geranylgeranyl transferase type-1 subunit beta
MTTSFHYHRHVQYFAATLLRALPGGFVSLDTNKLTLVHFAVHALDLLGVWENDDLQEQLHLSKSAIVDWIYSLQILPMRRKLELQRKFKEKTCEGEASIDEDDNAALPDNDVTTGGGFVGGHFLGSPQTSVRSSSEYRAGHIAMTYTALCTLACLQGTGTYQCWNLPRQGAETNETVTDYVLDREAILASLRRDLQMPNGSFIAVRSGSESDVRFTYCAACIAFLLQAEDQAFDQVAACRYVHSCRNTMDGAFGLIPLQEGHGGSTFCAVASLLLLKESPSPGHAHEMLHWCISRQHGGMQGRPNKLEDTCYSYWIGATLRLISSEEDFFSFLDHAELRDYVLSCQTSVGGFSKMRGTSADLLHSFYSLAYLSLSQSASSEEEAYCAPAVSEIPSRGPPVEAAADTAEQSIVGVSPSRLPHLGLKRLNATLGISQDCAQLFGEPWFP